MPVIYLSQSTTSNDQQSTSNDQLKPVLTPGPVDMSIDRLFANLVSHGMCLYQVMMTLHFLNDIADDAELTQSSIITL